MRLYQTVLFKSVLLTLSLVALYIVLILMLVEIVPSSNPSNLALFAIDFSFVVFIFIGFQILKPFGTYKTNNIRTLLYFIIALFLSTIWFVFSPIVALNNKEWSLDLRFSSKSFTDLINNPISYKAYRFLKIILIGPILEELFYGSSPKTMEFHFSHFLNSRPS
jgi:membrane protease YdiL (CAAX protease family)